MVRGAEYNADAMHLRRWLVMGRFVGAPLGGGAGCGSNGGAAADGGAAGAIGGSTGGAGKAGAGQSGQAGTTGGAGTTGTAGATSGAGATGGASATGTTGGAGATSGAGTTGRAGATGTAGAASMTGVAGATGAAGATSGTGGAAAIGNPGTACAIPAAAAAADVSHPTTVVGDGTPASCTADKVVAAVHAGGVVTFSCGAAPLTIVVPEMKIFNDGGASKDGSVTIDGGGKITLSGGGKNRILRQSTCDSTLHYTSMFCNDQQTPHLVVQNIGFTAGSGLADQVTKGDPFGGGALYVGGGTFKAVNITVTNSQQTNAAGQLVQDLAGGAIYTFEMSSSGPTYIVDSTFEGNSGVNGGALGSIGTSWTILNCVFKNNAATGHGENPARPGTEGGGLGGAIYNDGNNYTLTICGSQIENNLANELGSGAVFEVVDNNNGFLKIDQSMLSGNSVTGDVQGGAKHPGIYVQAKAVLGGTAGVTITNTTF